ncbi:MAG TPA: sulfatase-like hydrolase/transferase, partial [Terriglobales bacterium]|nr:sulfatase-like hydrolase/transferase [Terriglobales bacterium]
WIAGFAAHAPVLYWAAFLAGLIGCWEQRRNHLVAAVMIGQAILGLIFTWKHLLVSVECDWWALAWALFLISPTLLLSVRELLQIQPDAESSTPQRTLFPYSTGLLAAAAIAVVSILGLQLYHGHENGRLGMDPRDLQLIPFVIAAHLWLATLLLTGLNAVQFFVQRRSRRPRSIRRCAILLVAWSSLTLAMVRFLGHTLTTQRWYDGLYAAMLAATLVCWAAATLTALWTESRNAALGRALPWIMCSAGALIGLFGPVMVANSDWNGVLQDICSLMFWSLLTIGVFRLRSSGASYSLLSMAGVLAAAAFLNFGLRASGFLWAHQLGKTDEEVVQSLHDYQGENASFELAQKAVSSPRMNECDEFCRTLRQYTNVANAQAKVPLKLVDKLVPASGPRPNIFIFVVDSLRPDYVGAYNRNVDFTPNLDALAADSVVMKNAFTPYAGTTLAEPAIWTGALLLHAHYQHPFDNLNLLKRMAKTDGYKMVLSYDTVLRRLIAPEDVDVKLDADKLWKSVDLGSTLKELKQYLDHRGKDDAPILFYAQPIDIQELGQARIPSKGEAHWRERPGFNNRIAYQLSHADAALGEFIAYLKAHDLYENSVIIVTADHGDALGDMGRRGHSYILYPEIMRIPLIVHLPQQLRAGLKCDPNRLASLIDITPTLYYLLGHRPIRSDFVLGQPLFFASAAEMQQYPRQHLLMASDIRAGYGIITGDARNMYVTYDSPQKSYLFDLVNDPIGARNVVTDEAKKKYNALILNDLGAIAAFYDYRPSGGESGALNWGRVVDVPSGYFAQQPGGR